jgi:hypothetical protein
VTAAADDVRVQEARRRLAAMPPDTELSRMTQMQLVVQLVRAHGAAQMLDAWIRDHGQDAEDAEVTLLLAEEDTRRLAAIRDLLARFSWEHDDRQYALEAIERITDGGQP